MSTAVTRMFPTHALARRAAEALGHAGVAHECISLVDQPAPGGGHAGEGGTLMTIRPDAGDAADIERLLAGHAEGVRPGAPAAGLGGMAEAAPAYVAGGTANIGVPGSG